MKRDVLDRADLAMARVRFEEACRLSRWHVLLANRALDAYGAHGALISGCVRGHFPETVREALRILARGVTAESDAAYAARPPRVRMGTMRRLASAVARRDGSGYYGPQP